MRILYFHQHFVTPHGAGAIRSYAMARRLIERGHRVTMVCGSFKGGNTGLSGSFTRGRRRGLVDEIDVIELDLLYSNHDSFAKRAVTFLKFAVRSLGPVFTEKFDILFSTTTPLTAGIPGIVARWFRGKQFVFEVRDLWPELPRAMGVIRNPFVLWGMDALEWISYHSASRLIGLSPGIANGIARRGIPANKIKTIPNGCDLDIFNDDAHRWRPDGISDEDLMVVFAGTHGIANGLDSVLDVGLELKRRGRIDIKLLLIGQGKLKKDLQSRARREALQTVVFHEPVSKICLAGLMNSADIGLQVLADIPAFYHGTSPNKFFDYIAAGVPVLNNYPGWVAEMIDYHQCGFVVPPKNPVAFADALEWASINRTTLKLMGNRAKALAETRFSRIKLADFWVNWVTEER